MTGSGPIRKGILESYQISLEELGGFDEFPPDVLQHLKRVARLVSFKAGEEILRQGDRNDNLYFLVNGHVEVFVDGGLVANLGRQGDLIGEMSVITEHPVAATIVAKTDTDLLRINAREFENSSLENPDRVRHILYRIFSVILIDKLRITNQKAKVLEYTAEELRHTKQELELANVQLERKVAERTADLAQKTEALAQSYQRLEQQNVALLASHSKIEELYSSRKGTFKKLKELFEDHLEPLTKTLDDLGGSVSGEMQVKVQEGRREVEEVKRLLYPVTQIYSSEMALENKRILLCEPNRKQQALAKLALGGTGAALDIAGTIEEGIRMLEANAYSIIFVEGSTLPLTDFARAKYPETQFVFVTSDEIPKYLPSLRSHSFIPNLISRDENDRTYTARNFITTVTKLMTRDLFGLEKYLAWGVDVLSRPVTHSEGRAELIQKVNDYFGGLGVRRTIRDRATTVLEEILMNAIYDAPVSRDGQATYNHLSRQVPVHLKPEEQAVLRYASDGMLLAISVEDPFGALTGSIILDYLDSCYGGKAGSLNTQKGGAGRGLHQIVEISDLVVFNVARKSRTEVIALFNVDLDPNQVKYPAFHYFSY